MSWPAKPRNGALSYLHVVDYSIERLSSQNLYKLIPLYRAAFNKSISKSSLAKKYDTKSFGVTFIGFLAITKAGKAAAYYGVIPCHFQINGSTVLAAQSADTMTHPDHRHKGLFHKLATLTYQLARIAGIEFVFGFPNQQSLPGFNKLRWQFMPDPLKFFSIKVKGLPYARLFDKHVWLWRVYQSVLKALFPRSDVDDRFFQITYTNGVKHDHMFEKYKTYNISYIYGIAGVKLWLKIDGRLKVGAIVGLTKANVAQILSALKTLAFRLGCAEVIFMTSMHSALYDLLAATLIPHDAFPIGFFSLREGLPFDQILFEYCDLDIF